MNTEIMDHDYINQHGVVSLYVMGKLSPDERIRFEDHFVDCPQCLEQVELTEDLRGALKQVAKEDAARPGAAQFGSAQLGVGKPGVSKVGTPPQFVPAPTPGLALWRQPRLLAYASLVFVLGGLAVFFAGAGYRRSELAETRRAASDWQRRYADKRQSQEALQKQAEQSSAKTEDQNTLAANVEPAPLFFLNVTRGSDEPGSSPANRVAVPSNSPSIVLSLEFEKDPAFQSYRAQLKDAQGHVLWSAEKIPSPPTNAIAVTLPSHLLSKGNYSVTLDGLTSAGRYLPAAHFSFQATQQK